ncbi:MAG TPA: serine/threonine-protein kinase [Thermoanaerobaculia bacterium]|nr:serine/threonine-protein kinase [Thermoanaerobaculia bacterium]
MPLGSVPDGGAPPLPAPSPLGRGTPIGRYLILDVVGTGGMGVVHAGYDPELDRKVALKLLRPDRDAAGRGEAHRLRLLREAQAIARLSHPNVIQVYDVGTFEDRVFIAMELVQGRSLRQWLREAPRSWREVTGLFSLAGWGLAAAHEAGLVHRDFKPDNVLLGDDGRVRVADFGLAREAREAPEVIGEAGGEEDRPPPDGEAVGKGSGNLALPLTEWGVVVGTPAYMAPELFRGERADARSDQFSFCTALWEALYSERPFDGGDARELAEAYARGAAPEPPARTEVPAWLRQVLQRGLSLDPAARYPSMDELLRELDRDPVAARRRWSRAAAVAAVSCLAVAGVAQWGWSRAQLCRGGEDSLARVWNDEARGAGRAAFRATGLPFAEGAWTGAERLLDRYARDWTRLHRESCEATRRRGEQSEELLDRRMACLDQRLGELRALSALFARADAGVVEKAERATNRLVDPAVCSDVEALTARVPLPREPERRARVEELQARLAEAKVLSDAGKEREALARLRPLVAAARSTRHRPLEAEVLYLAGYVEEKLGESRAAEATVFEALLAAHAGGHREAMADAAAQLSWVIGYGQARAVEGQRWARLAQAMLEGLEGSEALRARVANRHGGWLLSAGRYEESAALFRQADRWAGQGLGPDNLVSAAALGNLAIALEQQGRWQEALEVNLRALAMRRRLLEPDHPDLARSYNGLGNVHSKLGQKEKALEMYRAALRIFEASYGPGHLQVAGLHGNIGSTLRESGRFEEAMPHYRRCLASLEKIEPEGPNVSWALSNLGMLLFDLERYEEALPVFQRSVALDEKLLGPSHPDLAYDLDGLGHVLHELGRPAEAVPLQERALALRVAANVSPILVADSRFGLARALWDVGSRDRALRLARQARATYAAQGEPWQQSLAAADAWLRERERGR